MRSTLSITTLTVLLVSTAAAASAAESPPRIEFKIRLAPTVADEANQKRLWELIAGNGAKASHKPCRLVEFLDSDGEDIREAGYLLRRRVKMDDTGCTGAIPDMSKKGEVTLKFRSDHLDRAQTEKGKEWAQGKDSKLEQDMLYGACCEAGVTIQQAFSVSADRKVDSRPNTMKDARGSFLGAGLPEGKESIGPDCRQMLEDSWELESPDGSSLPKKVELVTWSPVRDGKKGDVVLAELSFKSGDPEDARADALVSRLLRALDPSWLACAGSKTGAAYECGKVSASCRSSCP